MSMDELTTILSCLSYNKLTCLLCVYLLHVSEGTHPYESSSSSSLLLRLEAPTVVVQHSSFLYYTLNMYLSGGSKLMNVIEEK